MKRSPTRRQILQSSSLLGIGAVTSRLSLGDIGQSGNPPSGSDPTPEPSSESLEEWLEDANGYRGEVKRFGPRTRPLIHVGMETDDGFAFSPPAIEVPPMTSVVWDWTGQGGQHNVVALDGTFDSGRTNAQPGTMYQHVFEETGTYRFVSEPDRDDGMKGVVVVAEPPATGNDAIDEWVVNADNFDGTVTDRTGTRRTTIAVGSEGPEDDFTFSPPVLKVSAGTTVRWEWMSPGSPHNVVFRDREIGMDGLATEAGVNFEHAFEEPATYLYACEPHSALGMRGAVIVE